MSSFIPPMSAARAGEDKSAPQRTPSRPKGLLARFRDETGGQIAIIFGFASLAIFAGLGAAIDLATAYAARQRLSEVATLACQYSTRPSVATTATATAGPDGFSSYVSTVNAFAAQSLTSQHWNASIQPVGADGIAGHYFTATPATGGTTATANTPSNPVVEIAAAVPAAFGKILHIDTIAVHAKINCQGLAYTPQIVNPPMILKEGFEQPCSAYCFTNPSGGSTVIASPTSTFATNVAYTGYNGFKWYITGYCLEVDRVGVINASVPEGSQSAELDCDNGSGNKGNSSISTPTYLAGGQYELRYFYRARVDYRDYDPAYICGSTTTDTAFATNTNVPFWTTTNRTNQINVYLDKNIPGSAGSAGAPPMHQTLDGSQTLAGSAMIDSCVYSKTWIERSVRIKVTTPGNYWLTFAADGDGDSYGGQIDNIRLCQSKCTGSVQDNFPWAIGTLLYEDTFDNPVYTANGPGALATNGNPAADYGASILNSGCDWYSYLAPPGWPCQAQTGWKAAPYNQVDYGTLNAAQGNGYLQLDGVNASGSNTNRVIAKPFMLDPGYYKIAYNYVPGVKFSTTLAGTYCASAPVNGQYIFPNVASTILNGTQKNGGNVSVAEDTNIITVFLSNGQLVSTPNGGTNLGAATNYTNPDGSITATPAVAPDSVNLQSYNGAQPNALLDVCGYTDAWIQRTVSVKITKPGMYWLTFSSQSGTADKIGGAIDDIKVTALGSLYGSAPSGPTATIPTPGPAPDSSYAPVLYGGYTIVANPLTPPGADQ